MKRTLLVGMLVAVLVLTVTAVSFAQEPPMGKEGMMGKGMKEGMMKKHPGLQMMKGMMGGLMVATKDGGVIVMIGNRLLKYDRNLNLQKEVEIKLDMEKMKKMMKWHEKCSMKGETIEEEGVVSESGEDMAQ